ncbi:hypothetical protein [Sporohalobacter salinus]|uniref:hypothetical protein n=1 Tax=Sporohalobacter salinus TaxID=1494606 RepID=UPI0019619933|nr:hypothetical protein [Sporohalobacter salinus]MBM7623648.1 hypothetical protein [Sporohalobacter salinus]
MAKQKQIEINGTKFTLQHPGVRWYINLTDRCRSNQFGVLLKEKYNDELLSHVVVKPDDIKSLDSFGPDGNYDTDTLGKLIEETESFLNS